MKQLITKSILAGALIAMAGWAYLSCQSLDVGAWSKVIGAAMFSVGLIAVILLEANLFTGKVGYIDSKEKLIDGLIILLLNLIAALALGLLYRYIVGESSAMDSRLAKPWYRILADGIGCGACIYIAVEGYKKSKSLIPVIIGVMAFILGNFEHCIADIFYFGASAPTWKGLGYVGLAIVGNSIGSLACRWLQISAIKER